MDLNYKNKVKALLTTLAGPIIVYLFFYIASNAMGNTGFGVGADLRTIIYNTSYSGFIALAVAYNLKSGRFDFSVGSVMILAMIVGGNIAKDMGLGAYGLLGMIVLCGAIIGIVSGIAYITLNLPSMVTSLGLAMIYEAAAFAYNNSNGIKLIGKFDMLIWASWPRNIILLLVAVVILSYVLYYTQFGYNTLALEMGQRNAVAVGINEKKNAVLCYMIAGGLMACAGVIYLSQYGYIRPETGLASSKYFIPAFLPLFISGLLERYSNRNIGIFIGAFMQACLSSGVVKMGASSSLKTVIDGVVVLLLLVYVSNSHKIDIYKMWKEKKTVALAELKG